MEMFFSAKAPAKVNLFLDVLGVRDDGYHNIHTVMQSIDLCDVVSVKVGGDTSVGHVITVACDDESLVCDDKNLAYRAASAYFAFLNMKSAAIAPASIEIFIKKNIPIAAGLGGGSADAAAVLILLNRAFDDEMSLSELCEIGSKIGADVPFCVRSVLFGGAIAASGIGDVFTECLPLSTDTIILVAAFDIPVSTPWAYREIDRLRALRGNEVRETPDIGEVVSVFTGGSSECISSFLHNSFESAVIPKHPVIGDVKAQALERGAYAALMSGSGASVFALFENETDAQTAAEFVQKSFAEVKKVFVCRPYEIG